LKTERCGGSVLPRLKRIKPVPKSATAGVGQRPDPDTHYESLDVDQQRVLTAPDLITTINDVITRGATFLAMFQRLTEAFPQAQIQCFVVVRTMSGAEVD
jgi:hypothetical protein